MICPKCKQFVPDANYRCPHCRKVLKEGIDPLVFQQEHIQKKSQSLAILLSIVIVVGLAVLVFVMFIKGGKGDETSDTVRTSRPDASRKAAAPQPQSGRDGGDISPTKSPDTETGTNTGSETEKAAEPTGTGEEIALKPDASESGEKTDNPYDWVDKDDPDKLAKSHVPGEEIDIEKLLHPGKTTIFDFYSEYCPPCRKISPALAKLDNIRKDIVVVKININQKGVQGIDWSSPIARQYQLRSIPYFIIYDSTGYRTHEGEEAYQQVMEILKEEKIQ